MQTFSNNNEWNCFVYEFLLKATDFFYRWCSNDVIADFGQSRLQCHCTSGICDYQFWKRSFDMSLYVWIDWLIFGVWRHFQQYFSYILATSFSDGRSRSTRREPPTMGKQLVNFIACGCESSAPFFVIYKAGREPTPYWW